MFVWRSLIAINVEIKIFVVDFFVFAVGANGRDGSAEFVSQLGFAFANRNAGTFAVDCRIGFERGEQFAGRAIFGLQPVVEHDDVIDYGIKTSSDQIQFIFVWSWVKFQIDVFQFLLSIIGMRGRRLCTDYGACQVGQIRFQLGNLSVRQLPVGCCSISWRSRLFSNGPE